MLIDWQIRWKRAAAGAEVLVKVAANESDEPTKERPEKVESRMVHFSHFPTYKWIQSRLN